MPRSSETSFEASAEARVHRSELTPARFLWRSAAVFPERTAVVHGERRLTYAGLATRARLLASALLSADVSPGDRIAILCPNTPAMLEAHFGVPAAGCVLVPINVRLSAGEVAAILEHSGARLLVVDRELAHLAPEGGPETIVVDDSGEADDPYERFLRTGREDAILPPLEDEESVISLNYTSGTTGRPKGAMLTHRGAFLNALGEVVETGLGYGCVYLWVLPMFHCNGWCHTWAVTAVAGTHVCLRRPEPGRVWELLRREGVTHACGAPTVWVGVVNDPSARPLERQATVSMGGAPPSPTLLARMSELGFRPIHLYGLTETYGPSTVCVWHDEWGELPAEERARLLARQGHAHLTHDPVRVVDPQTMEDVPADGATLGEVVLRGNNVMRGYFRDDEATAEAFAGGWFHTGDLAVRHPDGSIELRDRSKDIIVSGGENISSIEVEQAIVRHPAVLECAVVAVPDERWGERPKAFVALKPGATADERELIEFCRSQIAHFKCPSAVEFGELPKTSTGKIRKNVLREREWASLPHRVH